MSSRHAASPLYSLWAGIKQIVPCTCRLWRRFRQAYLPCKNDSVGQWIIKITALVLAVVLIVSVIGTMFYVGGIFRQRKLLREYRSIWNGEGTQEERFDRLLSKNGDYFAWLEIAQTSVSTPVFRSEREDYYHDHNAARQRSSFGALYLSNGDPTGTANTVIRGRNPKSGGMFAELEQYRRAEYCQKHPDIYLWTRSARLTYRVCAVLVTNTDPAQDSGRAFAFDCTDFDTDRDFETWSQDMQCRSLLDTGCWPFRNDRLLTLVTDTGDFKGAKLVVIARRISEIEEKTGNNRIVTADPQAYLPEIWYQKHGLKSPWHKE